ncbi:hypothetical protein C7M84_025588 [Penaeus vannamei]|uniref:Uncharacterized protein n=1 Tax=Penaeus vannamei TaxID=6689 RepID=A0A423TXT4_PENVA|nr:hypothetical protein C7M84_025588 [Penaeus vannamei]
MYIPVHVAFSNKHAISSSSRKKFRTVEREDRPARSNGPGTLPYALTFRSALHLRLLLKGSRVTLSLTSHGLDLLPPLGGGLFRSIRSLALRSLTSAISSLLSLSLALSVYLSLSLSLPVSPLPSSSFSRPMTGALVPHASLFRGPPGSHPGPLARPHAVISLFIVPRRTLSEVFLEFCRSSFPLYISLFRSLAGPVLTNSVRTLASELASPLSGTKPLASCLLCSHPTLRLSDLPLATHEFSRPSISQSLVVALSLSLSSSPLFTSPSSPSSLVSLLSLSSRALFSSLVSHLSSLLSAHRSQSALALKGSRRLSLSLSLSTSSLVSRSLSIVLFSLSIFLCLRRPILLCCYSLLPSRLHVSSLFSSSLARLSLSSSSFVISLSLRPLNLVYLLSPSLLYAVLGKIMKKEVCLDV